MINITHYITTHDAKNLKIPISIFLQYIHYDLHNSKLSTPILLLIIISDSAAIRGLSLQHLFWSHFPLIHNAV